MDDPKILLSEMTEDELMNVFLYVISRPGPMTEDQLSDIKNIDNEFLIRKFRLDN